MPWSCAISSRMRDRLDAGRRRYASTRSPARPRLASTISQAHPAQQQLQIVGVLAAEAFGGGVVLPLDRHFDVADPTQPVEDLVVEGIPLSGRDGEAHAGDLRKKTLSMEPPAGRWPISTRTSSSTSTDTW